MAGPDKRLKFWLPGAGSGFSQRKGSLRSRQKWAKDSKKDKEGPLRAQQESAQDDWVKVLLERRTKILEIEIWSLSFDAQINRSCCKPRSQSQS